MDKDVFRINDLQVLDRCFKQLEDIEFNGLTTVTIETGKKKRSLNANALWHKWLMLIAKETGQDMEDLKDTLKVKVLGVDIKDIAGVECVIPKKSSKLDKDEFSKLMEATEALARMLEIKLPAPDYYGY